MCVLGKLGKQWENTEKWENVILIDFYVQLRFNWSPDGWLVDFKYC